MSRRSKSTITRCRSREEGDVFILATDGIYEFASASLHHRSGGKLPAGSRRRGEAELPTRPECSSPRQPDHPDRESTPATGPRDQPAPATGRTATGAGPGAAHGVRRLSHRARSAQQQPPAISISPRMATAVPAGSQDPSIDLRDDPAYRERFMLEEWIARRINSAPRAQAMPPDAKAQLPLRGHRIHRRPDAGAMDA